MGKKNNVSNKYKKVKIGNNKTNNKNTYAQIVVLGITLLVILLGASYGFLSSLNVSKNKTEVVSGTLTIEYEDSNNINLGNASPLTDEEGMKLTPYIFTIKNTGTLDGKYNVSLDEKDGNTLDKRYIKYSVKESDGEWSTPAYLNTGLLLTSSKIIKSGEEVTYQLKMWLDEKAGNDVQGQKYDAKIVVNTVQTNADLKDIENPIIILNGNTTVEIEQNEEFIDPGISKITDKNDLSISDVTIRYEYFDGINTTAVDKVDTSKIGTYYIYYEITDKEGNKGTAIRVVNVAKKDQKLPTIALIGDEVITLKYGVAYVEYGAQSTDEEDGNITDRIKITGTVNEKAAGTYIIKYTISDSAGNTTSTTREVIVLPKEGTLNIELKQDNTDITKTQIDISAITDAEEVKYAITTTKDKPLDKQFKTLEELQKEGVVSKDGKIEILKNGTYYIWVKDANGNIKYQEVVVTTIDETIPLCSFGNLEYIGEGQEREIELTCTDIADITEKELTKANVTTSTKNGSVVSVDAPQRIENGYKYLIKVKGVEGGNFNLQLKKNSITDKARNGNNLVEKQIKVTSLDIGIEGDDETVTDKGIVLDVSNKNEITLDIGGNNVGELTFKSENESIAKVTEDGKIQAIAPGKTYIVVTDKNTGLQEKVLITVEVTLTASFEKNGYGVIGIGKYSDTCKLTADNPTSCKVTAPIINVKEGYTSVGWNSDKLSHTGSYELELTKDTTFYTITSKDAITLTAKFDANGATISENTKTCTLDVVYNNEDQSTSCKVITPTITASNETPVVVGYSEELKETTEENLVGSEKELTLNQTNNNHTWYAITKSNPITYEVSYDKNGVGVEKIGATKSSCTIPTTYNGKKQDESCNVTLPSFSVTEGFTIIGWNEDKTSHEGSLIDSEYALNKNTTLYAISKKNEIVYTANFIKNGLGVTSIGATNTSCTLEAVYNNETQATSCKVELPTIEVEGLWKVLGWSEDSLTHTDYTKIADGIILTKENTTLYPITKKDTLILDATFNENGATLSTNEGISCTLPEVYNNEERNDYCVLTTPEVTRDNFEFIGYSTGLNSHENEESYNKEANQIKLDVNNTGKVWYAITKRDLTVKYNKNGAESISKETDSCTIWNSATTCDITLPDITRDTFDILGWNEDKDATIDSTNNIKPSTVVAINEEKLYYAITKKDVTISFNKNNSIAQTDANGDIVYDEVVTRDCRIVNKEDSCSIKSPSIAAPYETSIIVGYGISSDSTTSAWDVKTKKNVTENATYYAITKNNDITYNAEFVKQGLGVTGITSTQASCTIPATYNGKTQLTSCNITLPTINVEEGYTALGWNENKDATTGITNSVDIKENKTYYAISKKDEVILTGTFYKNGAASQTLFTNGTITETKDEKVEVSCNLEEVFNNNVQATTCSITSPIINASNETPEIIGYAESKTATVKDLSPNTLFVLDKDIDYYAITKKDAVTYNAYFDENNSKLSSTNELSCTIPATYNGKKQLESCNVNAPCIEANTNTPVIVGFNTNSNSSTNNESYNLETEKLTLNKDNTNSTWYAITKKNTVTYKVNYKIGDHVTSIAKTSGKCVIPETYNGTKQTTVCIIREDDTENNPEITPNVGYTSIGWSQLSSSTVGSPAVVLTQDNMTFYAHAQANPYNINYVSDNAVIGIMSVTYDEPFTLKTIKQLNLTKRGYTFNSWTSNGVTYQDGAKVTENLETETNADVYFVANWDDLEKPTCRFIQVGSTTTQNTTLVKMECTDTGSGVKQKTLTPNDFKVSNGNGVIDSVSAPTQITDGYSYDLTVRGISVGSFDITIPAGTITDNWDNPIVEAKTPNSVIVNGRVYTINYTKGSNVDEIGATTGSCITEGSSIVCNVILPSITASKGYTSKGWLNDKNTTNIIGSSYELTETTTGETLTAISVDITPPKCSISGNPTSWTQSAVLTVSAIDEGSGLADSPYSWTSKTTGFTTTTTKTITTNGEHKAYAKDKSGNVGECSVTATKIDTTKPACEFSNISDTTIVSGNTATLQLTCTDTQSLINTSTNTLSTSNFTLSSTAAKITAVSAPTAVTNGYKYTVTVQGVSYGAFTVSLNANVMKDNASNYNAKTTSASMTSFNKATTGSCNTLTYNGAAQTLASGGTGITFTNNSQTNANTYTVTMTPTSQYKFSDEATSKTLSCSIAQKAIAYKADSATKTYDGTALTKQTATLTSGSLVSGHTATPSITGTITNVGNTTNTLNAITIKSGTTDVTSNYKITRANGTLTVNKRATTCTSAGATKVYDGTALTNKTGGSCTNLVSGHTTTFTNTGTITNVGTANNTISSVVIKNGTTDVTNNYTVTKATGTLKVTIADQTVKLSAKTATYNGAAISANTATTTGNGSISYTYYTNNTCTTQTTTATGASAAGKAPIDAGTYYVKATAAGNSNYNVGYSSCVSHVINKKSVAVSWGTTTTFTMNSTAQAPTASASSGVTGETLNITRTTATAVGSYTSTASISSVTGGRAKISNYTLTGNTKAYTINGIKFTATYNANGATLSGGTTSCTTTGTNTSCAVTTPTITRSGFTIRGFNRTSTATAAESGVGSNTSLTLNSSNTGKTWYAITDKTITVTWNANGATIGRTSDSCTIRNTATTCSLTSPTITRNKYVIMGWDTSSTSTTSSWNIGASKTFNASSNSTYNYYAITIEAVAYIGTAAEIGKATYYTTISNAVDDAATGDEIKMLKSTTENVTVDSDKNISLLLNDFTVTGKIANNGNLTITSGTLKDNGDHVIENTGYTNIDNTIIKQSGSTYYTHGIQNEGNLKITSNTKIDGGPHMAINNSDTGNTLMVSGELTSSGSMWVLYNEGEFTMNGGTIIPSGDGSGILTNIYGGVFEMNEGTISSTATSEYEDIYNDSESKFVMNGGTISLMNYFNNCGELGISGSAKISSTSSEKYTLYNSSSGNIEVLSGKITSTGSNAIYNNAGIITISGGTISSSANSSVSNTNNGIITISGGTISSSAGNGINNYATLNISGSANVVATGKGYPSVYNQSTGIITMTGGTISTSTSNALSNVGTLNISGSAKITSTASGFAAVYNKSGGNVSITEGTISATASSSIANESNGTLRISGGTISTSGGNAVNNSGILEISRSAKITSTASGYAGLYTYSESTTIMTGGNISQTKATAVNNSGTFKASGGTISTSYGNGFQNYGNLEISGSAKITSTSTEHPVLWIDSTGILTMTGGNILGAGSSAVYNQAGIINVSGGTISTSTYYAIDNYGELNISGSANITSTAEKRTTIWNNEASTMTMTGGTISHEDYIVLYNGGGTVKIAGGNLTTTDYNTVVNHGGFTTSGNPTFTNNASSYPTFYNTGTANLQGGRFVNNNSSGYALYNSGGTMTVSSNVYSSRSSY